MNKCKVRGNIIEFVTEIPAEYANEDLVAVNEDKEAVYKVVQTDDEPFISKYGLGCNTVIDGKLAVVAVAENGATPDDIKKAIGDGIVAANAYIPLIVDAIETKKSILDSVFEFV